MTAPLIGSVFERTTPRTPSAPSHRFNPTPGSGFPTAQHRFKSAFARARGEGHSKGDGAVIPPVVSAQSQPQSPTAPVVNQKPIPTDTDSLCRQIHEENARRIASMTEEEIEREKRTILEQLGEGTEVLLRRVQEARWRKEAKEREKESQAVLDEQEGQSISGEMQTGQGRDSDHITSVAAPTPLRPPHGLATKPGVLRVKSLENIGQSVPSPLPPTSSTRPSSRTSRRLRFAEVTPDDVHVYESAPRSPKRSILALPPPPDTKDDSIISLGTYKNASPFKQPQTNDGSMDAQSSTRSKDDDEPEEGTAEYIRRRYFPSVSPNDPNLAWMETSPADATDPSTPRFNLHGVPIPASLSATLPSHLGLHHHSEGTHAGYTLDDIFLLSRSTVPAQRASLLGTLAKIAHRLGWQVHHPDDPENIAAFVGQEGELRKRILVAGLSAIDQIGSLGARAVEVVWECLVQWDTAASELDGIELSLAPDVVASLQLDYLLPKITEVLSHVALPSESLARLLAVVHWLAQQSNDIADMITNTPRLIPTILMTFLLTPIPPGADSLPPSPLALELLITLASASRSNASTFLDPADALLRFVILLPPSSPYPSDLASTLLTYTLRFYKTLASYGLYSHIATTASQAFTTLAAYVVNADASNPQSIQLRLAWTSLVQAWMVCAIDPHATSPPHDILWSQIGAYGWAADVRKLRQGLGDCRSNWSVYAAIWETEAVWLEGARINCIKAGETEREEALQTLRGAFSVDGGIEFGIVMRAVEALQRDIAEGGSDTIQDGQRLLISLASAGNVIASALRLFLACLPPLNHGIPLSPPFALPLSALSALSAALVKNPVWSLPSTLGAAHFQVYLRPMTSFIAYFHRASRYMPGTTPQLWFAQALVFLSRLLPGDESHALTLLDAFSLVTPHLAGVDSAAVPANIDVQVLCPFLEYAVRPEGQVSIAPLGPSTESIARCSTLRLPCPRPAEPGDDPARTLAAGLPLTRDFLFTPLTHLLRSGASPVCRALPHHWGGSEVDVVRATLLLALAAREALTAHGLQGFAPSAAEAVFACMRVCMLEHGVGGGEEVFRDAGVEALMARLLAPLTARQQQRDDDGTEGAPHTLEDAAAPYLGPTPFYQFYTDLVALYGAVSFGHATFAALVVTPLAMRCAVDCRRALWCGDGDGGGRVGDVVRSVRVPIDDVVCTGAIGVREYLYPIERDAGLLGTYVTALMSQDVGVQGFLRFVAVHHVACTVWADLDVGREKDGTSADAEGWARWLRTVLGRGSADVVREVVLYRQRARGALVWPPACYRGGEDDDGGWQAERLAFVCRSMGEGAADRVRGLLTPA